MLQNSKCGCKKLPNDVCLVNNNPYRENFELVLIKDLFPVRHCWPTSSSSSFFFLYRAPIVCTRCCLVSSALILRGGHPGRSKQQPHRAADSAGLSLPLSPPPLLPHGRHICSPPFYAAVTLLFQEREGVGGWGRRKSTGGKEGGSP